MVAMLLSCRMAASQSSPLCCLPARKRAPSNCRRGVRLEASAQQTSQSLVPNLAPCVLPLCLALLLAKEWPPHLARADQQGPLSLANNASVSFVSRVDQAISLLEKGRQAQARGDFLQALLWYTQVIKEDGDLALSEYARVGRAISLYEVGDREEAFAEMEDVSISLKGYPEIHAALAAVLYTDKNSPLAAEQQFTIATLLDPHYADLSYVKDTKHWPPSLVRSLAKFMDLQ